MYLYTYLFGVGIFFIPWLLIFVLCPELRKEMVTISIFGAIVAVITSYLWWTVDWWRPDTITGTRIGIEDALLGFSNGGVAAVLYQVIYGKKHTKRIFPQKVYLLMLVGLVFVIMSILFWGTKLTSFYASVLSMVVFAIGLFILRKDLWKDALLNGVYMMIISVPVYILCEWVFPGCIQHIWIMKNLSGILFVNIPVEDLVFYFQLGVVTYPLFKIWNGFTYRNI